MIPQSRFVRRFGEWRAELQWALGLSPRARRDTSPGGSGKSDQLRAILRRTPWWVRGHLELGFLELRRALSPGQSVSEPLGEVVASSARAVLALSVDKHGRALKGRERLVNEARYLLAMVEVSRHRFVEALGIFAGILARNNAMTMRQDVRISALEHAAKTALTLGSDTIAYDFLTQIPAGLASSESETALRKLRAKEPR